MGDRVEEELPDEEDGGLLVLLLDVHGYNHNTHSSHIPKQKKNFSSTRYTTNT